MVNSDEDKVRTEERRPSKASCGKHVSPPSEPPPLEP